MLGDPLKEFKEIELINKAGTGKGSSSSAITDLVKEGIILEKRAGKTKLLSLNLKNSTVFLLKLLLDQNKLKKLNKSQLASILLFKSYVEDEIELLILFGSSIAGTATSESDMDILLVSKDVNKIELVRKKVEELFGQRFNMHYSSKKELNILEDSFVQNAFLKGSILCGYDFAKELFFSMVKRKDVERLAYFYQRVKSAFRNYVNKDYVVADEVVQRTLEQVMFYVLTEKKIAYTSKKDAEKEFSKIKEGSIIKSINKATIKDKIIILEDFVMDLLKNKVVENDGYVVKSS